MLIILLASIVGILEGLYLDFYLSIVLFCLIIFEALLLKLDFKKIIVIICCSLIFNIYTILQVNRYDTKYNNGPVEGEFKIISYREEKEHYDKYIAKSNSGDKFLVYLPRGEEIKKGTTIYGIGEFSIPDLQRNSGGFNYRRYLNSQKIFGNIYIKDYYISDVNRFNLIYYIQDEIYTSLGRLFPQNEMGLILGMMIGETKDISENTLEDFKNTGITHLVAVSGSNVIYVFLLVQFVFKKLIGKKGTYFVSIGFLILFMLVSGGSSSVMRATIMMILTIIADILYLKSDTISNISFSAVVLMIINPLVIYDVGFILSFGGTLGIVLLSKNFEKIFHRFGMLSETLAVTCSAQLVLMPIMMYYFNTFSILSVITNLIVVPISGSITVLGFVVFIVSKIYFQFAKILSGGLYVLSHLTIKVAQVFSKVPFSNIQTITPNIFEIVIFYFLVFYITGILKIDLLKHKKNFKFITARQEKISIKFIVILISTFICAEVIYYNFPRKYIDIHCIDVGQGDAIFIETNNRNKILIDGGGSETYDVGNNILLPYLLDRRVMNIDVIFSTHSDADHLNGLIAAIENISVNKIIIGKNAKGYEKIYELAKEKNIDIVEVLKGDVIQIGDTTFEVISPDETINSEDVNDYSLVIKLIYGDKSMLFTGDISKNVESKLFNIKSDILKVAHHGSNSSSSDLFIHNVHPSVSIIEVGENNKYGHPNEDVVRKLEKISKVYTTAKCGEINIKMYKNYIKVSNIISK